MLALRFATVLRESGTEGSGGAAEAVAVPMGDVVLLDPVSPARMLDVFVDVGRKGEY